ncbi:SMC family ATPase [Desulfitobacterium sp. THU1]|uniref:SMC family ATPase n=1 Tax=Desulfitobacterium sp. THU1 TaxID=3138072 RepID=UPI00311F4C44
MKPIKLKIRGLNSFTDLQEVDFLRLTDKGLFGIFGPTGSGKSTILDGITLALYGAVARGSSNYMNTNSDGLNVSYEFQISEKEIRKYRVDREFRRDSKTGHVRSKSAKIVQITEEGELVLEEQATKVTEQCEMILGLQLEDFTRTVVLPQGKFSEFLKLEGKERREMLERLFNLQRYGDDLSIRLAGKIRQEKDKAQNLAGELKTYEEYSAEILQEKTNELSTLAENLVLSRAGYQKAEEDYAKGKQLWDLQSELEQHILQKSDLEKRENEIKENENKAEQGERALRVKPYLDHYEETLSAMATTQKQIDDLKRIVAELAESQKQGEERLIKARFQKDQELPLLRLRQQSVAEAIEEKKKLNALLQEKNTLQAGLEAVAKEGVDKRKKAEEITAKADVLNADILAKEKEAEDLTLDQDYKKKVNEAIVVLNTYEHAKKQVHDESQVIEQIKATIQGAQARAEELAKQLAAKDEEVKNHQLALQNLISASPGDQDTLMALQDKVNQIKDRWSKHAEYTTAIAKAQETIVKEEQDLQKSRVDNETLELEINRLELEIKAIENENRAHILREELRDGEACPVCGAKEHHLEALEGLAVIDSETPIDRKLEQLSGILREKQAAQQLSSNRVATRQETIRFQENTSQEYQLKLNELGEEYKAYSIDELQKQFEQLKEKITLFHTQKDDLEQKNILLKEDQNAIKMKLNTETIITAENKTQLESRQSNLSSIQVKFEEAQAELLKYQAELGVEDFLSKQEDMIRKDKQKANLELELKQLREQLKGAQGQRESLNHELAELREVFKEKQATLVEKESSIQEKETGIKAKVGGVEDLAAYQQEISDSIIKIDREYLEAEEKKKLIDQQYNESHTHYRSAENSLSDLTERMKKNQEALAKVLREEKFQDSDEAKGFLIERAEIERLKIQVREYRDLLVKLAGSIDALKAKMGGRSLSAEQWQVLQTSKEEKNNLLKALEENKIKLESSITLIKAKYAEKTKLLKNQEKLDYQLGLLNDLEKLFKGKRFVEYVAAHQLKYVSIEADKKLKEITGGNYGLEVDENGKFIIRDYKNGGAQRDASTLSGGETFLASLALALALSAQIQLKGTAPLELFFLDEGFGTLDDNLLEVVMDTLERIHHDKLSIGIISHVESIKNRVPVKLMVTPAKAGLGGSKVAIEVS